MLRYDFTDCNTFSAKNLEFLRLRSGGAFFNRLQPAGL
jgi:hypothetical protein